jgi:3-hydroxymyristoyl/3-hydroxydecanoyl-(acyl carrier protein) dehydratase
MTPFAGHWRRIHTRPTRPRPGLRLYGNAFGRAYEPDSAIVAEALTRQALDTVDFPATLERAWADGVRVFVECGPRSALAAAVRQTLDGKPHLAISFDQAGTTPDRQVARIAAALFTAGHGFDPALFELGGIGTATAAPPGPVLAFALNFPAADLSLIEPEPLDVPAPAPDGARQRPPNPPVVTHLLGQRLAAAPAGENHAPLAGAGVFAQAPLPTPGTPSLMTLAGGGVLRIEPELPPVGLRLDRAALERGAQGRLSDLLGPLFARQDGYARQVRMPRPPLLLADRVTGIAGEAGTLGKGIIWTETEVRPDAWYLSGGRMPPGIAIESGQADLLLISWLGVDFLNQGERVYRLLGCEMVFHHGGLPRPGDILRYQIHVDGHARLGDIRMFFFHYDCRIGDRLLLSVRNGQAGFFSDAELAQAQGVLWSADQHVPAPQARLDPPPRPSTRRAFSVDEIRAFSQGDAYAAFGPGFELAAAHQRTPSIPQGRLRLIDSVSVFDPAGGPWGRGYLAAEAEVPTDAWFYQGHFHNDPCMPGTLMADAATQALSIYLAACGLTLNRDGWRFEPVPETAFRFFCRGQVIPDAPHHLTYEVFVEELIAGPEPAVYASLLCARDGLKVFHCPRFGLRLVPDWPLAERRGALIGDEPARIVGPGGDVRGDFAALLACAWGAPSQAFGRAYARFDDGSARTPRLPGPPYHVVSRILSVDCPPHEPKVGGTVAAAYDVPADAWYFADNATGVMPFSILLEVLLQPCGWLATYMGFALEGDLFFRNLDGVDCRALREVGPDSGTLRVEAVFTGYSKVGALTLVKYRVACRDAAGPVMTLDTGFGFFSGAALAHQKGLPVLPEHRAIIDAPPTHDLPYGALTATPGAGLARLATGRLAMVDRITGFWPGGGHAGLGRIRGRQEIDPGAWYFKAHFFGDPVQPGSLGLEGLIQLLTAAAVLKGLDRGLGDPAVEALAVGQPLIWKYRGQVLPKDTTVTTHLDLTRIETLADGSVLIVAEGSLWVGPLRIYEVQGLSLRLHQRPPAGRPRFEETP